MTYITKWSRLKNHKCPKCNYTLETVDHHYECSRTACTFSISHEKFNELVNSLHQPKPRYREEEDNLNDLNNLNFN